LVHRSPDGSSRQGWFETDRLKPALIRLTS
jgi:hypothetical protein